MYDLSVNTIVLQIGISFSLLDFHPPHCRGKLSTEDLGEPSIEVHHHPTLVLISFALVLKPYSTNPAPSPSHLLVLKKFHFTSPSPRDSNVFQVNKYCVEDLSVPIMVLNSFILHSTMAESEKSAVQSEEALKSSALVAQNEGEGPVAPTTYTYEYLDQPQCLINRR